MTYKEKGHLELWKGSTVIPYGGLDVKSYPEWLKWFLDQSTGSEVWIS